MLGFTSEAKAVLKAVCEKIVQRTPKKYLVAQMLTCLDPQNMASNPCTDSKRVTERDCDDTVHSRITSRPTWS